MSQLSLVINAVNAISQRTKCLVSGLSHYCLIGRDYEDTATTREVTVDMIKAARNIYKAINEPYPQGLATLIIDTQLTPHYAFTSSEEQPKEKPVSLALHSMKMKEKKSRTPHMTLYSNYA